MIKKTLLFTLFVLISFVYGNIAYCQYLAFGTYQYRVDKPSRTKFVTYNDANVHGVIDSASLRDRFTKEVVMINRKSYGILLGYIKSNKPNEFDFSESEQFEYIENVGKKGMIDVYRFSLDDYKQYLKSMFLFIKASKMNKVDTATLISTLQFW